MFERDRSHIDYFSCLWWVVMFTSSRHYVTFSMLHVYSLFAELCGSIDDKISNQIWGRTDHFTVYNNSINLPQFTII
jgi:hypothetical protein